jgi:dihydrofolate synthase/folylpolyglutamate synthase
LLGRHQAINGTVALAALDQLKDAGFALPQAAIDAGLKAVHWNGRLEVVKSTPQVVLDAAHNGDSAQWLAKNLAERFPQRPRTLVFGAKLDKDIEGMLAALLPVTDHLILTQAVESRAEAPEHIAQIAQRLGYGGPLQMIPPVTEALAAAESNGGTICVTGSLYLVGEARDVYGLQVGQTSTWEKADVGC